MKGQTTSSDLPPGFRFHPTDEELIMYYLRNQATATPCPVSIIPEVELYKFDPWQLPAMTEFGENEWYFFTPRDRKYPNGVRPNRATVSGYWKATGTDKAIYSGSNYVGIKKSLVFYKGRPPKGIKTDWIMHEYRLNDSKKHVNYKQNKGSMRLDDWVLCRIYKKRQMGKASDQKMDDSIAQTETKMKEELTLPRNFSLSQLLEMENLGQISQLINDFPCNSNFDFQNSMGNAGNQMNQSNILNQPVYLNPIFYEFQ